MMDIWCLDKTLRKGDPKALSQCKGKPLWIDVTNISKSEAELLRDAFDLHPVTVEDILHRRTRIKVEEFPHYLFCVFYGAQNTTLSDFTEFDFVIGEHFLITSHLRAVPSFDRLKEDAAHLASLLEKGSVLLFHRLLATEIDAFGPLLEKIEGKVASLETGAIRLARPELMQQILKLKHQLNIIKRTTTTQREKLSFLAKNEYALIPKKAVPYLRDVYDQMIHTADRVDASREHAANAFDVYMSSISNNTNQVMKVLSIIATIALPLTVISGIYGTNFAALPGSAQPYGFWVMVGFMALLSTVLLLLFRKRGWF